MSENPDPQQSNESLPSATAQAVSQLVKEVPIYQDAVQPAAQQIGKGLGGLLAWMMSPLQKLGIAAEANVEIFKKEYEEKIQNIPSDKLEPPDPIIMGPTIQALTYTVQEETLRGMFVNLLAAASNSDTANSAHPAFVEVIRQMSPTEARLIKLLGSSLRHPIAQIIWSNNTGAVTPHEGRVIDPKFTENGAMDAALELDNLERLNLVHTDFSATIINKDKYSGIIGVIEGSIDGILLYDHVNYSTYGEKEFKKCYQLGTLSLTSFGRTFIDLCC